MIRFRRRVRGGMIAGSSDAVEVKCVCGERENDIVGCTIHRFTIQSAESDWFGDVL